MNFPSGDQLGSSSSPERDVIFEIFESRGVPFEGRPPANGTPRDSKISKITSLSGLEDEPSWSPDGKFIAYTADDRGNFDILVQPVSGGQVLRIGESDAD